MTTPILSPIPSGGVLVASPSMFLREQVLQNFSDTGCAVSQASGGAEALVQLEKGGWQVLFLDRRLPDLDAEELIGIIKRRFPGIEVVLLDSDSGQSLPLRRDSDEEGATRIHAQTSVPELHRDVLQEEASSALSGVEPLPGMIGKARSMLRLYKMVRLVARRTTTVLILGATGTGKELVASALHKLSPRAARPFVVVNCAAIPEALLESELFGHVRGAFTGAVQSHFGRIQAASGGTLFLDEIGELSPGLQAKLLRFFEQKEIQRLGSADCQKVDVRVVAATNQNLLDKVEAGSFREDLYYRLSTFPIELPRLVDRTGDITLLAQSFLARATGPCKEDAVTISAEAARMLEAHPWPGNVRELQHVIERAAILAEEGRCIRAEHLYFPSLQRVQVAPKGWNPGAMA
jgi:transcriptional regulator with GAF, ATPase, and Fis domain